METTINNEEKRITATMEEVEYIRVQFTDGYFAVIVMRLGVLMMAFAMFLVLAGCKKQKEEPIELQKQYNLKMSKEDVGHKHNVYLDKLLTDAALDEINDFGLTEILRVIDSCASYAIADGHNSDYVNSIRDALAEMFTNDLVVDDDLFYVIDSGALLEDYLVNDLNYSTTFGEKMRDLHYLGKYSTNNLMDAIHDDFGAYDFGENENQVRDLFVCIADSSESFWHNYHNTGLKTEWGRREWTYFNDALGGIWGFAFGGVGSVICGAAFSYVTEKHFDKIED